MVGIISLIFWVGILVVGYTYVGYGIIIYILSKLRKRTNVLSSTPDEQLPAVTLLVAAYNEADIIRTKIQNTLELDYPKNKLEIFFVTDGSTDQTPEIVRHYQDPTIGGVAGEKRILSKDKDNASGSGEGLYWKYESFLKKKDAEVYSIVGAAGELFSVRTDLFEEPAENMIIEDFYLSMRITAKGYRFAYEPDAFAMETASASVKEEWKRKVRISAGGFQAMSKLSYLLNPFRYGILSFQYISHRVLRWTLAPFFLPIIFIANVWLAFYGIPFYQLTMALQVFFYGLAFLGYLLRDKKIGIKGFFVPYYFAVMNLSVYFGLNRYLRGKQSVVWEKAKRATA